MKQLLTILLLIPGWTSFSQSILKGTVKDFHTAEKIENAQVQIPATGKSILTDSLGRFSISIKDGRYRLVASHPYYQNDTLTIVVDGASTLSLKLNSQEFLLNGVTVRPDESNFGFNSLNPVEGLSIYKSKKTNLIKVDAAIANKATNNPRQMYNQVAGLNIWESDGAGIQLGIGGRGLSPNRTSNFNVRQNGYDISADALGYPESYYTPPAEGVERIEIVRGAASLQYGTQFGGLINFKMKSGPDRRIAKVLARSTIGSYNLENNFFSIGGRYGTNKYYGFYQNKSGDDFRPNSGFQQHNGYVNFSKYITEDVTIGVEYTHMNYLAKQPGGLTDQQFEEDHTQSNRTRNWFKVDWNLAALHLNAELSSTALFNLRTFGLLGGRESLGFLGRIDRIDPMEERTLIRGRFKNIGAEARFMKRYGDFKKPHILLIGTRGYLGNTIGQQGAANDGSGSTFEYMNADSLDSDYAFPSKNLAFFAENIFQISEKFSVTPGLRLEYILTEADGYYTITYQDLAGNIIEQNQINEAKFRPRAFALGGIGASYQPINSLEFYLNFSQNYRAITFNDIRIQNPNFRIDPNIQDESGFSADIGWRGKVKRWLVFDITGFYLYYNNRIGLISQVDSVLNSTYMLRTNISNSANSGVEFYLETDFFQLLNPKSKNAFSYFANFSYINAEYISSENTAIDGNEVELVPPVTFRTGLKFFGDRFGASWQFSYTDQHFTDATNAIETANAVNGIVPAYWVQDLSFQYTLSPLKIAFGINNLTNEKYFTRRASGYPGPGILPALGRNLYFTVQVNF